MRGKPALHDRLFRRLLRLFPAEFRREYGGEMEWVFRERRGEAALARGWLGVCRAWGEALADLFRAAPREHWEMLRQDVSYALRSLVKNPGFSVVVILTLALAMGASTALFSLVRGVVLAPLPYREPASLVAIWEVDRNQDDRVMDVSYHDYKDYRRDVRSLAMLGAITTGPGWTLTLTGGAGPRRIVAHYVSGDLLPSLGLDAAHGRLLTPADDAPDAPRVVLVSHAFWSAALGGDPEILGTALTLDGQPFEVVGVMPPGFEFGPPVDLWIPLAANPILENRSRGMHSLMLVGRLGPGVHPSQAAEELAVLAAALEAEHPETNEGHGIVVRSLHEQVVGDIRPALLALLGGVGFVLLIACANVAGLFLSRSVARQREVAVRTSLGATRARLVRQFLTEGLVVALLGGAAGVALAFAGVDALLALSPERIPRAAEAGVDRVALAASGLVVLAAGILFGLAPTTQTFRRDLREELHAEGRATSPRRSRTLRDALVVAEMALALILLVGAGLLGGSFVRLLQVDPGFSTENILTFTVQLPRDRYGEWQKRQQFGRDLMERLEALPGIVQVGATNRVPMSQGNSTTSVGVRSNPLPMTRRPSAGVRVATPGYFQVLGVPLLAGRGFQEADDASPTSRGVVVVNRTLARLLAPDERAVLGEELQLGPDPAGAWFEVVGVVGDVLHFGLGSEPQPEVFMAYYQRALSSPRFAVRAGSDPGLLAGPIRAAVRELDPELPVSGFQTTAELVLRSVDRPRFALTLFGAFAVAAVLLAAVGLYGVVAYAVRQRTHEIGIRMALGARRSDVLRLVLGRGVRLTLLGAVLGTAGALALTRFLDSLLFGISPTDPAVFSAIAALLIGVSLAASYLPARRATRVNPQIALRSE